jgi:GAF domain-containing protein
MTQTPAPLQSELVHMLGRPFGVDERGNPIDHGSGKIIVGSIEWMRVCVGRAARAGMPVGLSKEEQEERIHEAQDRALDRLVEMLNAAIADPRYHVTREYLLDDSNRYSYEFRLFVSDYCRVLSGDPDFFQKAGGRSIPAAISLLAKPLGVQRVFAVLPRFMAKLVRTDLRVVSTAPTSAVIRWYGASQLALVPAPHRQAYVRYACQMYQGGLAAIPEVVFGLPAAGTRESRCQADGGDYCEWEFTWTKAPARRRPWLLAAGAAASAPLLGLALAATPATRALTLAGALLPALAGWYQQRLRQASEERDVVRRQLDEERDLAEEEYDRSEGANARLQVANVELQVRVSELTALHDVALALSATLDLEEVLDSALRAVVSHLGFDRAMLMLLDDAGVALTHGRAVGGTPEMGTRVAALNLPLELRHSQLVQAFYADEPMVFHDVDQDSHPENRALALDLAVTSFAAAPLLTKGRRVGVLAVDNGLSGRPLDTSNPGMLLTLGRQVAAAIENARLYAEVEAQNRLLEERVEARTAELARTTRDLERELEERRRLRQRELEYLAQVNRVVEAAVAVENSQFDPAALEETAARDDEVGQLARTFRRMAVHMIEREESLRREVQHLRIEIDEARQAKQVQEIVETEYFRQLRSQASDLRKLIAS